MNHYLNKLALSAAVLLSVVPVWAQTQVNPNGTLTASTNGNITDNVLVTGAGTSGYNFSGSTGSFSIPSGPGAFSSGTTASQNGYFYTDFLISITGSSAESVTTSLQDPSGVTNLSERIYTYNSSAGTNGFLGDSTLSAAGVTGIQVWSTNYPLPGSTVSIISPTNLVAGNYVIELRGTDIGNFGGTLSITPVPEPQMFALMTAGCTLIVALAIWKRRQRKSWRAQIERAILAFLFQSKPLTIDRSVLG